MSLLNSPAAIARPSNSPTARVEPMEEVRDEFQVFVDGKCERCRHALFGGDELHNRAHPLTQRVDGLRFLFQLLGQVCKLLHLVTIDGLEQGFARWEMPVEGANSDPGRARDSFQAGVRATGTEYGVPTSRIRSRLRIASARRVRVAFSFANGLIPIVQFQPLEKRRSPPYMATSHANR